MVDTSAFVATDEDLALVRAWFKELSDYVDAVNFRVAPKLFTKDFLAFGTHSDFVEGVERVREEQWSHVWPKIDKFRWRLDGVRAFVSPKTFDSGRIVSPCFRLARGDFLWLDHFQRDII